MTTLCFQTLAIPGANWGIKNCLPDIYNNASLHSRVRCSQRITPEEKDTFDKHRIHTVLPYTQQSIYDRARDTQHFTAAVLENEYLVATFLPELGGRLWSLYHKKEQRELLYVNDVFQPSNLGQRNAWFAGGVEWNCGIRGHSPLTCSPLFAQKAVNQAGEPVLKMFAYERITGVVYSICATLKGDALLLENTIENTAPEDKWTYWWSNIAVEEHEKTRVLVPAEETFYCGYLEGVHVLDSGAYPYSRQMQEADLSYPSTYIQTWDMFYKVPDREDKWVAAVEADGKGLVQYSTPELHGRKLFAWGSHPGGRNWNQWLSEKGTPYIEIQAGLRKTQQEVVRLPGNSKIQWMEGYSLVSGRADVLHGENYRNAVAEIASGIHQRIAELNGADFALVSEEPPVVHGSGWGALENLLRQKPISESCRFSQEDMGEEQQDWLFLREHQRLPDHAPTDLVSSYVCGDIWREALEAVPEKGWYEYYHLGVLYYEMRDMEKAEQAFRASVAAQENPWALRCLGRMAGYLQKDWKQAAEDMRRAVELKPDYLPLLMECAAALLENGQCEEWIRLYQGLDPENQNNGRLQMLLAVAYTRTDRLEEAQAILTPQLCVPDIKEGEYSISHYWVELHQRILARDKGIPLGTLSDAEVLEYYPLPKEMDFRQDI